MKTRIIAVLLLSLALFTSCGTVRREKTVSKVANEFLTAYYGMDYEAAKALSTPELAVVTALGTDMSTLPEEIVERVKKAAGATSFQIVSIDVESSETVAEVLFDLYSPELEKPLRKKLLLKTEGRLALVSAVE